MDSHDVAAMQNAAYVIGMAAGALIEAMGMVAENQDRDQKNYAQAYTEDDFQKLMQERGLHHNSILTALGR
jgi:hypothetical protein